MKTLFLFSICLIIYTYVGYIFAIALISLFYSKPVKKGNIEPAVSMIIAAYNEEKHMKEKLLNTFSMDYPHDKLEIIVASDGSTDGTDEIARSFENNESGIKVVLHRVEGRLGKTATQNSAVKIASGEIIVFSDAADMYDRNAIRELVKNYADPSVGAVSGMYHYKNPTGGQVGFGTILFWKLENFIKSRQTKICSITGCSGCIYSVRKTLYAELPANIISDLVEPLAILRKGYRIVFEQKALAIQDTTEKPTQEFKMRIRVIVRGMNGLLYMKTLLNPFKYPYVSFQLFSHKILRWFVPVFCITAFISNSFLAVGNLYYKILLLAQCAFYSLAVLGLFLENRHIRNKIFYLPMYFTIVNAASLVSIFKILKKENIVVWQTRR
jgi:cellulose synthase/poly-beta-1,6-N-acetylglucosamine synthase-like glycosyltransferase